MTGLDDAFAAFDAGLSVPDSERRMLLDLRGHVAEGLSRNGRVLRVVDEGSFSHRTEVRGRSRFDLVVVLAGSRPKSLARALEQVRAAVPDDLPFVRVSPTADAVLVDVVADTIADPESGGGGGGAGGGGGGGRGGGSGAGGGGGGAGGEEGGGGGGAGGGRAGSAPPGLRLIPAFEVAGASGAGGASGVVLLPDAARRFVECRPGARALLLDRIDDGTVRALVRLVLAWKHQNRVAISSYYLETAVIRQVLQQPSFSRLWDVCWLFEQLAADDLMNLPDVSSPTQTQRVRAAASLARRIEAQFPLDEAAIAVRAAVNAYLDDDTATVARRLTTLFGPTFATL